MDRLRKVLTLLVQEGLNTGLKPIKISTLATILEETKE